MSYSWRKPSFSVRQLENHWMGVIFSSHDLWCHCDDVNLHYLQILNKNSNCIKPPEEIKNIKCLLTGDPGAAKDGDAETGLEPGELDRLFAEGEDEKDTG